MVNEIACEVGFGRVGLPAQLRPGVRRQCETELLTRDAWKGATHRVLLPAVAFMIAAIVVPLGWPSSAITMACLEFERDVAARAVIA